MEIGIQILSNVIMTPMATMITGTGLLNSRRSYSFMYKTKNTAHQISGMNSMLSETSYGISGNSMETTENDANRSLIMAETAKHDRNRNVLLNLLRKKSAI